MSKLQDFLNENAEKGLTKEVIISSRIRDEEGLLKFKIKALTCDEIEQARQKAAVGGSRFSVMRFHKQIALLGTLDPQFKSSEEIEKNGCFTPEDYMDKILRSGEIENLSGAIQKLSGYGESFADLVLAAKN